MTNDEILTLVAFVLLMISEYLPFSKCSQANGILHLLIEVLKTIQNETPLLEKVPE